eukprot:CAMPEP_0116894198 /NCGR_PEP_ID=MMETSP0467-20121206/4029_1 /TAXON_ID=283647 /ORGANISM="Mesodinium pulex, Strain SPMC105" /LENGTH=260 /DNA_ID=CAMNT_0004564303 /DNA_START=1392 /DNA_END=2170 /DNA_ORIENTATION=-
MAAAASSASSDVIELDADLVDEFHKFVVLSTFFTKFDAEVFNFLFESQFLVVGPDHRIQSSHVGCGELATQNVCVNVFGHFNESESDGVDQHRLAAAIGSDEPLALALVDFDCGVPQQLLAHEGDREVVDADVFVVAVLGFLAGSLGTDSLGDEFVVGRVLEQLGHVYVDSGLDLGYRDFGGHIDEAVCEEILIVFAVDHDVGEHAVFDVTFPAEPCDLVVVLAHELQEVLGAGLELLGPQLVVLLDLGGQLGQEGFHGW